MDKRTPPNLLDIINRAQHHMAAINGETVLATFDANDWIQAQHDIDALLHIYLDTRAVAAFLIPFAPLTVRPDTSGLTPAQCVLLMMMHIDAIGQKEAAANEGKANG
jgi:hypothetical protein